MSKEIKPFIPVWLDGARLKPQPFRILCNLYSRRNAETGRCDPSVARIAADCCIHRDTVWRWLQWLEKERWLVRSSGGGQESNKYALFHFGACLPNGDVWPAPNGISANPAQRHPSGNGGLAPSGKTMLAPSGNGGPGMYNKEGKQAKGNKYSPNPSEQRPSSKSPALGKPEIEALLASLDLPDATYGHVHARMEAMGWRTPEGGFFRARASTERFLAGLAGLMDPRS